LKSAATATVAVGLGRTAWPVPARAQTTAGLIHSIITDASGKRFSEGPTIAWGDRSDSPVITIDASKARQTVFGFGSALTDAACYTLNQLPAPAREKLFHELFSPDQMGLCVCRLCIGASDYSTELYSYDEGAPDPSLNRFSIDHDRPYLLPILRQARGVNSNLFFFASPWSPPGWMKYGGSMLGGNIKPKNLETYAHYILKYLQGYESAGVTVNAITIQNEVDADQAGAIPACPWPQETEIKYIANYLGPLLSKFSPQTKIWLLDHNYDLVGRVLDQLAKPEVKQFISGIAWHGYSGSPGQMTIAQNAYPDVDMYWTEGGSHYNAPDYLTNWSKWSSTFCEILQNGPRSITTWNLALDEHGKPNIGPFFCGGLITVHSQSHEVIRSGIYWALSHYSRAFRPGAKIIETHGNVPGVSHIGAQNSDGSIVLIVTNPHAAQPVQISRGKMTATVQLSADSVTTLRLD
jgi:glucosylceramidase